MLEDDYVSGADDVHGPFISHPIFGGEERNCCGANELFDALYKNPDTREMYLRRLRSLMDQSLQAPGTDPAALRYEARLDAYYTLLNEEAAADYAKWGTPFGVPQDLALAMGILKTNFLAQRRVHLYQTHSTDLSVAANATAGIPPSQTTNPYISFGRVESVPSSGDPDDEFIELINTNSVAVDISGWRLTNAIDFVFPPGTVIPRGKKVFLSPRIDHFHSRTNRTLRRR
jgi:hypothetical protein